jgi:hypothetical protein
VTRPAPRRVTVGRILHYWTYEGARLIPNPAMVLAVGDDGARLWVQVFWASGAGGRDQLWAPAAPFGEDGEQAPTEGHWTWPVRV